MKTPDIILEQMLLGEKQAGSDAETITRLRELGNSNREILQKYPSSDMKQAIADKLSSQKQSTIPFTRSRAVPVLRYAALAAAACFTIAIAVLATTQRTRPTDTTVQQLLSERPKGDATRIYVYRKAGDQAEKLETGDHVSENDILQVSYNVSGNRWGFIFSVDGNGVLTQHYPDRGTFSALLDTDGEIALPFSYKLDDAPLFERFIMISAEESFSAQPVLDAVRRYSRSSNFPSRDLSDIVPEAMTIIDIVLYK